MASLGHPNKFNGFRVLPSLLQRRRSPKANQTSHDVWPSPGLLHYIYIFGGSKLPLTEFCQVQNSLYVQVLCSRILAALPHGTPASGVSQILRRGTRNGITELSQRVPPIFGTAAITLGIGPHSSLFEPGNFAGDSNDSQYSAGSAWHHWCVCVCTVQPAVHQQSRDS